MCDWYKQSKTLQRGKERLNPTLLNFTAYLAILSFSVAIIVVSIPYRTYWRIDFLIMPMDGITGLVFAAMGIGFALLALAMLILLFFIGIRWISQVLYEIKRGNKKGGAKMEEIKGKVGRRVDKPTRRKKPKGERH